MKKDWKDGLSAAGIEFMQDIISQVPAGMARMAFEKVLNNIAEPDAETRHRLEKLQALENHGVDNWDGYDDAMDELSEEEEDEDD